MAIIGKNGIKYSYASDDLIQELEADIEEFGDAKVIGYYKREHGAKLYYDYLLKDDVMDESGKYDELSAWSLLQYLKAQSDPM